VSCPTDRTCFQVRWRFARSINGAAYACLLRLVVAGFDVAEPPSFTEDPKPFEVPALLMHDEDDQIVPVKRSARKSASSTDGSERRVDGPASARIDAETESR
jgi:hypothetical protein